MSLRWKLLLVVCVAARATEAAGAARTESEQEVDDATPDVGLDDDQFQLEEEESRNLRPRAYTPPYSANSLPSGFRPSPEIQLDSAPQRRPSEQEYLSLIPIRAQQQYDEPQPTRPPTRPPPTRVAHKKFQDLRSPSKLQEELEDELEEKEEPDRLTLLLQQSKFDCVSRQTGYYADEELNCEVFHYCHDSVKHSWICPNGFIFHQVHLICMPPSGDTICQRSSKYHFVNEYLYRPINTEEHERKPNVTLKYSDRYYPADIYRDDRYEDEEEDRQAPEPLRPRPAPAQQQYRAQPTPAHAQVFRSAEEVNIPLVQRRPLNLNGFVPTQRPYTTPADFDYQ